MTSVEERQINTTRQDMRVSSCRIGGGVVGGGVENDGGDFVSCNYAENTEDAEDLGDATNNRNVVLMDVDTISQQSQWIGGQQLQLQQLQQLQQTPEPPQEEHIESYRTAADRNCSIDFSFCGSLLELGQVGDDVDDDDEDHRESRFLGGKNHNRDDISQRSYNEEASTCTVGMGTIHLHSSMRYSSSNTYRSAIKTGMEEDENENDHAMMLKLLEDDSDKNIIYADHPDASTIIYNSAKNGTHDGTSSNACNTNLRTELQSSSPSTVTITTRQSRSIPIPNTATDETQQKQPNSTIIDAYELQHQHNQQDLQDQQAQLQQHPQQLNSLPHSLASSQGSSASAFLSSMFNSGNSISSNFNQQALPPLPRTNSQQSNNILSHTPPTGVATSYENRHFGKRSRSLSTTSTTVSGRMRSATDYLESRGLLLLGSTVSCCVGGDDSSNTYNNAVATNDSATASATRGMLKDLVILGDEVLQKALDQYEEFGDPSALEDMIHSGALQDRLPQDLDLLGDLDLDFLTMDDMSRTHHNSKYASSTKEDTNSCMENDDRFDEPFDEDKSSVSQKQHEQYFSSDEVPRTINNHCLLEQQQIKNATTAVDHPTNGSTVADASQFLLSLQKTATPGAKTCEGADNSTMLKSLHHNAYHTDKNINNNDINNNNNNGSSNGAFFDGIGDLEFGAEDDDDTCFDNSSQNGGGGNDIHHHTELYNMSLSQYNNVDHTQHNNRFTNCEDEVYSNNDANLRSSQNRHHSDKYVMDSEGSIVKTTQISDHYYEGEDLRHDLGDTEQISYQHQEQHSSSPNSQSIVSMSDDFFLDRRVRSNSLFSALIAESTSRLPLHMMSIPPSSNNSVTSNTSNTIVNSLAIQQESSTTATNTRKTNKALDSLSEITETNLHHLHYQQQQKSIMKEDVIDKATSSDAALQPAQLPTQSSSSTLLSSPLIPQVSGNSSIADVSQNTIDESILQNKHQMNKNQREDEDDGCVMDSINELNTTSPVGVIDINLKNRTNSSDKGTYEPKKYKKTNTPRNSTQTLSLGQDKSQCSFVGGIGKSLEQAEQKQREKNELKELKKKERLLKKQQKELEKKQLKQAKNNTKKGQPKKESNIHSADMMDVDDPFSKDEAKIHQHVSGSGLPRSLSDPNLRTSIDIETGLRHVERPEGWIGAYSPDSRRVRIEKFLSKRQHRTFIKTVQYNVRKNFADSRLRVKGRFVKKEDELFMRELMSLT